MERCGGQNSGVVFDLTEGVPDLLDRAHAMSPINGIKAADVNARLYNSETLANPAQMRGHKRGLYWQTLHISLFEKIQSGRSLSLFVISDRYPSTQPHDFTVIIDDVFQFLLRDPVHR